MGFVAKWIIAFAFSMIGWACLVSCSSSDDDNLVDLASNPDDPVRILFIGSDFTSNNNMPQMLVELGAAANPPLYITADMVAVPDENLRGHWENGSAQQVIRAGDWDAVVLQGSSSFGYPYFVEGGQVIGIPDQFFEYSRKFDKLIGEVGAKTVFFSPWLFRGARQDFVGWIDFAYMSIAEELDARIAQVGRVWRDVLRNSPTAALYEENQVNPSRLGSFLASTVFFIELFDLEPLDLQRKISRTSGDTGGDVETTAEAGVINNSQEILSAIRKSAWENHQELELRGGYLDFEQPVTAEPVLIQGESKTPRQLIGRWRGDINVYPRYFDWPVTMELLLGKIENDWNLEYELSFDGNSTNIEIGELEITDSGISFVDPNGPNGAVVKYQGSFLEDKIQGTAEIIDERAPFYAIGSWEVRKN